MSTRNRTGQTFGQLTVILDKGGAQLRCRCVCGREGLYPREITKPSYRGSKACPWCLGSPCEECGTIIPRQARMPARTCSEICREARVNRRARERYERIKDTEHFQATRAAYLARLDAAMQEDPALAGSMRASRRRALQAWRDRQLADPVLKTRYLEAHRQGEARRLAQIRADPAAYAEHLRRQRAWYQNLSDTEYQRIFVEPRKRRDAKK